MPALVRVNEKEAIAGLGQSGDLTNPAQVAFAWWTGLLHDLDMARDLTYHPPAWGDYQSAISHLAGRSLASKVIYAVDAVDQIAFMRFVPEVAAASQVFEVYRTPATFLTLIRVETGNGAFGASDQPFCLQETSSAAEYPARQISATR